jgi:hypothetical protein
MVALSNCGNSKKNPPKSIDDINSKSVSDNQKTKLILEALKEGETHMTDSVWENNQSYWEAT